MTTWLDVQDPAKIEAALVRYRENPPSVAEYDDGDERYGLWLALVDKRLTRAIGVGLFDLADWNMRDAYDDGASPIQGARMALESDDLYSVLAGGE